MIEVLRLGHRRVRDARLTTHVCLTARALGARRVHVTTRDAKLEDTVADVVSRFGGPFEVVTGVAWRPLVESWKQSGGSVVHLTMYGVGLDEAVQQANLDRDVLLIVGGEKVPGDVYRLVDYNVAVGNQPHSEVAALALALDRFGRGAWVGQAFAGRVRIVPNAQGKTLIEE